MNIIKTERLIFRHISTKDIDTLLNIYRKPENMRFISNGKSDWTIKELSEKYLRVNKDYDLGIGIFVLEHNETGDIIGEAGLFNSFNDLNKLELGYIIDTKHTNKGFGTETCKALIDYAFKHLKTKSLIARMYANNYPSIKLSEKCGMTKYEQGIADNGANYLSYKISNAIS